MRQKPHGLGPPTARFKPKSPDHGRHIYAYRHVQTNQVLYSLTRTLDGIRSLRQLPDIGANTPQATGRIRRDLWRPLWSVTFPHADHGREQGQHAFRHLREWRRLHELYWKQPASLSQPMSEDKKKELQRRLDQRRVEKKETVFDLIKKEKKKFKREIIMDQKANSIADLAAVLDTQEWLGVATAERHAWMRTQERLKEVREMLRLRLDAHNGGIQKLEQEIADLQPYLDRQEGFRLEDGAMGQRQAQRKLYELQWKLEKMRIAASAFDALPQRSEQMRRLEEIEVQTEEDVGRSAVGEQATQLEGELDGIREAKELVRQGRGRQAILKAVEDEKKIYDTKSNAAAESRLSKAEAEELQQKVDGYEVALNPAAIFPKLQSATSANSIDPGASDLPAILKDINNKRSRMRVDKFRSWATGKDDGVEAQAQRLQHDKDVCERLMPFYSQAKSELNYEGGEEKVKWWIEDMRAKLVAAPVEQASQQRRERAAGLVDGYEKALEALKEVEGLRNETNASESSTSDAEVWLENLKERETTLAKWHQGGPGRAIKNAEREVPEMADTASAQSAVPIMEAKFLGAWIGMQKWAVERSARRLKSSELDALTPAQRTQMEDSERRLKEFQKQRKALHGQVPEEILADIPQSGDAITQALRGIEEELMQEGPGGIEPVQVLAAKLEVYREGLAKAQRLDIETVFPDIRLPASLQQTVDEWTDLRTIDYHALGPVDFFTLLPSFPDPPTPDPVLFRNKHHPITASFKGQQRLYSEPVFTLQGVRVKWHNILDAEFAASWPEDVVHEPMGLVTYVAPEADEVAEPILSVAEWRARRNQKRVAKRTARESVVEGLAEAVVRAVKEGRGEKRGEKEGSKRLENRRLSIEPVKTNREVKVADEEG